MNTSGDVDISPPDVIGGVGHSVPPEGPTSPPYVQVINQFDFFSLFLFKKKHPWQQTTQFDLLRPKILRRNV